MEVGEGEVAGVEVGRGELVGFGVGCCRTLADGPGTTAWPPGWQAPSNRTQPSTQSHRPMQTLTAERLGTFRRERLVGGEKPRYLASNHRIFTCFHAQHRDWTAGFADHRIISNVSGRNGL